MEPRIQYAKTSDGVSIAYWTLGEGIPIVLMAEPGLSHIQLEWQIPPLRRWYEHLAAKRMVVRYDGRGSGLSDRQVLNYSLDALALDLEAVVNRLGLDKIALFAPSTGGQVAVTYAAAQPEKISHLILWCVRARWSEAYEAKHVRALDALLDVDWETATETWARVALGGSDDELARQYAAFMRECTSPEVMRALFDAFRDVDVLPLLPQLKSPALILHRRKLPNRENVRDARDLTSRIPGSRLVLLEGSSAAPHLGDSESVRAAINEFLGEGEEAAPAAAPPEAGAFRTVLFTDVEGSTVMTQRLGDAKAREVMREHERITREALAAHGGSEVKTMGDGFMASFGSATKALECAIAMQQAFAARNASLPAHPEPFEGRAEPAQGAASSAPTEAIRVRIGLNAGEPIAEDDPDGRGDLFGTAVIRAARIAAMAQGGEILAANVVRELAEGKGFMFGDRGEVALRGFDGPVRVFEVRWRP